MADALLLVLLAACGPDVSAASGGESGGSGPVDDIADPVEVQPWMLTVFSNRYPDEYTESPGVYQYHLYENLRLDRINVTQGLEDSCSGPGEDDGCNVVQRMWEPRSSDSFAMFPGEQEADRATAEYLVQPAAGASAACGPYDVIRIYGPSTDNPGPQPNPETIYRGAVCQRTLPSCSDLPEGSTEPCGLHGGGYAMEWCDEPPAPCEEG